MVSSLTEDDGFDYSLGKVLSERGEGDAPSEEIVGSSNESGTSKSSNSRASSSSLSYYSGLDFSFSKTESWSNGNGYRVESASMSGVSSVLLSSWGYNYSWSAAF